MSARIRPETLLGSCLVQFRQFVDDDLGCASYLIGDESSGEAVVVDPAYTIEPYLEEAEKRHVRITRVLETHTHADHVSGSRSLRTRARRAGSRPSRRAARVPVRAVRGRPGGLAGRGRDPSHAHARPPARALLLRGDRRRARRRAVARHHRRLAPHRRRSPARSRQRGGRGRDRPLRQPAEAAPAAGRGRALPRPRGRVALRRGHELPSLVDDRLRARASTTP